VEATKRLKPLFEEPQGLEPPQGENRPTGRLVFKPTQRRGTSSPSLIGRLLSGQPHFFSPFNLLRCALRHPSQCSHVLVCDDRPPVSLFLSMSARTFGVA
jgi:hypothetical protein